jgi:hypothetical protein
VALPYFLALFDGVQLIDLSPEKYRNQASAIAKFVIVKKRGILKIILFLRLSLV